MNLAKVYYFLIKINATYYVAKTVIIASKKIKHYLLYEFSNMIRHEKGSIIEEEEDMDEMLTTMRRHEVVDWLYHQVIRFFANTVFDHWKKANPNQLSKTRKTFA